MPHTMPSEGWTKNNKHLRRTFYTNVQKCMIPTNVQYFISVFLASESAIVVLDRLCYLLFCEWILKRSAFHESIQRRWVIFSSFYFVEWLLWFDISHWRMPERPSILLINDYEKRRRNNAQNGFRSIVFACAVLGIGRKMNKRRFAWKNSFHNKTICIHSNTMARTRGQRIKSFTPLCSDDNELIVVGDGDVVVFIFVNSSHFSHSLDNHLSINVFYHKQITSTIIHIRQSGLQWIKIVRHLMFDKIMIDLPIKKSVHKTAHVQPKEF